MSAHAIFNAISLLTPFEVTNARKTRVGARADGGFVMFDDDDIAKVYSFGIANKITAEYQLAQQGKQIFLFDPHIDKPIWDHVNFNFRRLRLDAETTDSTGGVSLSDLIEELGHSARNDLFLKLDLEGEELDVVATIPVATLQKFRQIVIEVHWLGQLQNDDWRAKFVAMMTLLRSYFTLGHIHANNYAGLATIAGWTCPEVIELTFVRDDLVDRAKNETLYPTGVDHANRRDHPDHLLWFFPFLPDAGGITTAQYRRSVEYANRISEDPRSNLQHAAIAYHIGEQEKQLAVLRTLQASICAAEHSEH